MSPTPPFLHIFYTGCYSKSVICTPEVIEVPLDINADSDGKQKAQRFVIASDGLWDVMTNQAVGRAASRKGSSSKSSHSRHGQREDDPASSSSNNPKNRSHSPKNRSHSPNTALDGKRSGAATPKEAAFRIMEHCLKNGGNQDDVTICVVDVRYQ
jgi:serine/threonine protein phosphatase PrpC